jgi:hypothetical protein
MPASKLVNKREFNQNDFSVLCLFKRPPLLRSKSKERVRHLNSDKGEGLLILRP